MSSAHQTVCIHRETIVKIIIFYYRMKFSLSQRKSEVLLLSFRSKTCLIFSNDIREFKKLQRQLQGKRHIKIELCVKLRLLRLFHVDHVVHNGRSANSLAWHEWFSCKNKE